VAVALFEDGTFGQKYLDSHPLTGISISNTTFVGISGSQSGDSIISLGKGQEIGISANFANHQRTAQPITLLAQVENDDGIVVWIGWTTSSVAGGQTGDIAVSNLTLGSGKYTTMIMVLDGDPVNSQQLNILSPKLSLEQTLSVESENSQ